MSNQVHLLLFAPVYVYVPRFPPSISTLFFMNSSDYFKDQKKSSATLTHNFLMLPLLCLTGLQKSRFVSPVRATYLLH